MTINELDKIIDRWASEHPDRSYRQEYALLRYLATELYATYTPFSNEEPSFLHRLSDWLHNLSEEDGRKLLFRLLTFLFYVGQRETDSLFTTAFNESYIRWLIDVLSIDLTDTVAAEAQVLTSIEQTWFCPVTDSMDINRFLKINNLVKSPGFRPEWYTLWKFGASDKIEKYVKQKNLKFLVLLEDFVATGSQASKSVEFAASLGLFEQILVLPIISCPETVKGFEEILKKDVKVSFRSVLTLANNHLLRPTPQPDEPDDYPHLRDLLRTCYTLTSGASAGGAPFSPFGYGEVGAFLISDINAPDNTLPAIHHKSTTWRPLFQRLTRN